VQRFIRGCQDGIIGSLEKFFRWYGELVATHPKKAILACLIATVLGGLGLFRFYEEADAASIVIPNNSQFRRNIDWLDNNFPREFRTHSVVYKADNVLTPSVIQFMYKQRKQLSTLQVANKTFQDFCIQVPILKLPGATQDQEENKAITKRDNFVATDEDWGEFDEFDDLFANDTAETRFEFKTPGENGLFDNQEANIELLESWSKIFYPEPYCSAVRATQTACYELNILELWGDTGEYSDVSDVSIATLTQQVILDKINNRNMSQIFLKEKNFIELLGDIRYDDKGHIVGASTVEIKFFTKVNISDVQLHGTASRGEKVDVISYNFEGEMIDMYTAREGMPKKMELYPNIQRQFFESFVGQTFKDGDKLILGYILVFVYVNLMLSKFNLVQQRLGLSIVGIMSVFMGMILAFGLCSLFGLFYSAAHTVIPFLLLGIGIDNIFVITQAYSTLEASAIPMTLVKRMGQTMGHAGVAVSVTTFTDVIAFFVGSNTQLPGLESFCIYAAVSIFVIYCLQVTQFVAWFALDETRIADQRDGCVCCYRHDDFKPFEFSKKSMLNKVFKKIGILLTKLPIKIFILLLTTSFVVFGVWGTLSLTQEYQPQWLLPPESEIAKWFDIKSEYYPSNGEPGFVIIPKIDMSSEFVKIENLVQTLRSRDKNIEWVRTWTEDFKNYVNLGEEFDFYEYIQDDYTFRYKMAQFLFSPNGAAYQPFFEFGEELVCGEPAPDILLQVNCRV
jgi:Niemann-Pick C1 protein